MAALYGGRFKCEFPNSDTRTHVKKFKSGCDKWGAPVSPELRQMKSTYGFYL